MQFACDAGALGRCGPLRLGSPFPFEVGGPFLEERQILSASSDAPPQIPRQEDEQERKPDDGGLLAFDEVVDNGEGQCCGQREKTGPIFLYVATHAVEGDEDRQRRTLGVADHVPHE